MTGPPLAHLIELAVGVRLDELPTPLARLEALERLDQVLADGRALIADTRATIIADEVDTGSTRATALELGMSPAAVAKAVARARARRPSAPPPGADATVDA